MRLTVASAPMITRPTPTPGRPCPRRRPQLLVGARPSGAPAREQPGEADRASRARLVSRCSASCATVAHAKKTNTTMPAAAWLCSCSSLPRNDGTSETNRPRTANAENIASAGETNCGADLDAGRASRCSAQPRPAAVGTVSGTSAPRPRRARAGRGRRRRRGASSSPRTRRGARRAAGRARPRPCAPRRLSALPAARRGAARARPVRPSRFPASAPRRRPTGAGRISIATPLRTRRRACSLATASARLGRASARPRPRLARRSSAVRTPAE